MEQVYRVFDRKRMLLQEKNHYPDFIVMTKSGHIVMIETKGEHFKY